MYLLISSREGITGSPYGTSAPLRKNTRNKPEILTTLIIALYFAWLFFFPCRVGILYRYHLFLCTRVECLLGIIWRQMDVHSHETFGHFFRTLPSLFSLHLYYCRTGTKIILAENKQTCDEHIYYAWVTFLWFIADYMHCLFIYLF